MAAFLVILLFGNIIFSVSSKPNIFTSLNPNCPADCQDTLSNCLENIASCFDPSKYQQMITQCRCTCSFCPEPANACQDVDPQCTQKAYECGNDRYKPLMCSYCRKTCNLCSDPCASLP